MLFKGFCNVIKIYSRTQFKLHFKCNKYLNGFTRMDKQRVDPTFRKMALATELFVSRPTFEHIQNLHPKIYNLL